MAATSNGDSYYKTARNNGYARLFAIAVKIIVICVTSITYLLQYGTFTEIANLTKPQSVSLFKIIKLRKRFLILI
jgi:hypothetical protein